MSFLSSDNPDHIVSHSFKNALRINYRLGNDAVEVTTITIYSDWIAVNPYPCADTINV